MKKLQIKHYKLKIIAKQRGFTIIEVLVVAVILGVIGYMLSDIVARSLQGSQKTTVIGTSKQNGQVVLDSITQVIRNSDLVVCVGNTVPSPTGSSSGDNIAFYTQDGRYVRFRLDTTTNAIVEDFPVVDVLINNDPSIPKSLQANICDTTTYAVFNPATLSDTNNDSGVLIQKVDVVTGIFTTTKRPGSNDAVTVQFDVKPSLVGGGIENQLGGPGVIQFQQTVQLR